MDEPTKGSLAQTLRERDARYVVDTQGQAVAVLLTLEEYERFLDLLLCLTFFFITDTL